MRVPASTAIKLQAAACAGGAVVCRRLGASGRRAGTAAQAVHPGATGTSGRRDGLSVTLECDRDTGHTQIVVHDMRADGRIAFVVPPVSAADAFRRPFRYAP